MDNSTFFNYLSILPDIDLGLSSASVGDIVETPLRNFTAKYVRVIIYNSDSTSTTNFAFDLRLSNPTSFGYIDKYDLHYQQPDGTNQVAGSNYQTGLTKHDDGEVVKTVTIENEFLAKSVTVKFTPEDNTAESHCVNNDQFKTSNVFNDIQGQEISLTNGLNKLGDYNSIYAASKPYTYE